MLQLTKKFLLLCKFLVSYNIQGCKLLGGLPSRFLFLKAFALGAATTDPGRLFHTDMALSEKKLLRTSSIDVSSLTFCCVLSSAFIVRLGLIAACVIDVAEILEEVDHILRS